MTLDFGSDTGAFKTDDLPSSVIDDGTPISFYNIMRKRLKKFAAQFISKGPAAVVTMKSQGQIDETDPDVIDTRDGFNELRTRLPLIAQYYVYSGSLGATADTNYRDKIKEIVLDWADTNVPTGKPIDETNFELLIEVAVQQIALFTTDEKNRILDWLDLVAAAKEAWNFTPTGGEGKLLYGNHYTHHYKTLLKCYKALVTYNTNLSNTTEATAAQTKYDNLLDDIDDHAAENFPYGTVTLTYPDQHDIEYADISDDYFRVDGDQTSKFTAGDTVGVYFHEYNDGFYTVESVSYISGTGKTHIFVEEQIVDDLTAGGIIVEQFSDDDFDMPRAPVDAGESIDYIRRDSLHYQQYDLEPWLEIAITEGGTRYETLIDNAYDYMRTLMINPPRKHYEFKLSTDTFDVLRFETSHSQYLQPNSMYLLDDAARVIFAYAYYKQYITENYTQDDVMLSLGLRSGILDRYWYYLFRWIFGGTYG